MTDTDALKKNSAELPPGVPKGRDYALVGPQAEPTAAFWLTERAITVPGLADVKRYSEPNTAPSETDSLYRLYLDFEADFPRTRDDLDRQLAMSAALQIAQPGPYPAAVRYVYNGKKEELALTPLSRFLHLKPLPFGTIFDRLERSQPDVTNVNEQQKRILDPRRWDVGSLGLNEGQELARMFENETPGLLHRHALNWLLFGRVDVSPPRQARIWMALDMAIYTALSAAWHYKWVRPTYSRLLRPSEYADRAGAKLTVLYDKIVDPNGQEVDAKPRRTPPAKPGTPRHPAWPSGHSTYSAAASHLLEYIFSPKTLAINDADLFSAQPSRLPTEEDIETPAWVASELRRLANNVGEARLWGGVHWHSDHIAGQKVGRAAAQAVIDAFERDCTLPFSPPKSEPPPKPDVLNTIGLASRRNCSGNHDEIPPNPDRGEQLLLDLPPI